MAEEGCMLVMVIDFHPQLVLQGGAMQHYLNACMAFANTYLATSVKNRIAVLAASHKETKFLYPTVHDVGIERQKDGRLELLGHVNESIEQEFRSMIHFTKEDAKYTETLLSGAISRALCYIKRMELELSITKKISSRILIVKSSGDTSGQYLNYVNTYLTAQKNGTAIDVCVFGNDCGLLQQGADITGGVYHKVTQVEDLMQTLLLLYHADVKVRKKLNAPPPDSVDYRAACFCHRCLVDMGNVCSNCLSVYCKAVPLCSTCNVLFPSERPMKKPVKKKR
ncbi:transcription factor B4 [Oratosquilla oratoria]|uniref:transcription factor B4 n=1 Tax=Oratosquilla oratoria TaxID=337810 RepID=UPI003F763586